MLVLNLACEAGHGFEGWFASATDFESQQQRGLLSCPLCNSVQVRRMPSAPRLNLSAAAEPTAPSVTPTPAATASAGSAGAPALPIELQRQVMKAVRTMIANTEDVGERFATEARRIHYGETEQRGIRGRATPEEARDLADEGIDIVALPLPDALKDPLQ